MEIKLAFVVGLKEVVLAELEQYKNLKINREFDDCIYLDFTEDFETIKSLRSVSRAYIVEENPKYNPTYISNHKSVLGNLIEIVLEKINKNLFKTFKISCAGSDSVEVREIAEYIENTYELSERDEADLKVHIIKNDDFWEVGVQITQRPLSLRDYKVKNMAGAMDPTVAYALNSLIELDQVSSYLNVFSGSATLLIEAGQCYPNIEKLVGFDNNKEHLSLAIQNIKQAGLIKRIQLFEKNIFDKPDLGKFDVVVSDLPFGMVISKDENLEDLYGTFLDYVSQALSKNGTLAVFTSEYEVFEKIVKKSEFYVVKKMKLEMTTNINTYLKPVVFVCKFK